ncbi:MAG: ribonuclease III [Bacteroidales bacterium]|nr:ribonuclease III [Bacteroidales bacterium]
MLIGIPPAKYYLSKNKKFYKLIFQLTGIYPSHLQVFEIAFTHKSASRNSDNTKKLNNERLEFLGDAILASVVADFLYSYFPFKKEGFLTKMRARIVSREQLNEIALNMGLQFHIISQNNINGTKNIYGNALEALIGAIYVDKGYKKTKEFIIKRIIKKNIDMKELSVTDSDYKSQVIEWAQKNKTNIIFEDEEIESTEQNNSYFTSAIKIDEKIFGKGKGLSKKEAQQNASKEALISLDDLPHIL